MSWPPPCRQKAPTSRLTPQTLRNIIKKREGVSVLRVDHADDVDWDECAHYLETLAADLRERLSALPQTAGWRPFTADDLRAGLLPHLAEQVRDAERSDYGYWLLTLELRHEAQATTPVLQDGWTESGEAAAHRTVRAELLGEVADQLTAYRTMGSAARQRRG